MLRAIGTRLKNTVASPVGMLSGRLTSGVKRPLSISLSLTRAPAIIPSSTSRPSASKPRAPQSGVRRWSKAEAPDSESRTSWGKTWSRSILKVARTEGSTKTCQKAATALRKL